MQGRTSEQTARTLECPGGFASLRSVQGAGLACRLSQRFKAFHALRSPPETLTPLRCCAAILLALHQLKSDLNQKRLSYYAFLENDMVSKFLIMLEMIPLIKKYIQHTIKEE